MEWKKLELLVTNNCNFDCKYCYVQKKDDKDMTFEVAKNAIDYHFQDIKDENCGYVVTFLGGEPLLKYDLVKEIINYCQQIAQKNQIKIWYQLTTNGSLLTEEQCKFFKTVPFQLTLSVDGDKEMHDISRISKTGKSTYHLVQDKFKLFQKYFPSRAPHIVVSPFNIHKLKEGIDYLFQQGFNQISANFSMTGDDYWNKKRLKLCDEELKKVCDLIKEKTARNQKLMVGRIHKIIVRKALHNKRGNYVCQAARKGLTVSANGKICLCHRFLNMDVSPQFSKKQGDFIFGEIKKGFCLSKKKEKLHVLLKKQTKENLYEDCQKCKYYNFCEPPCFWINYVNQGDFLKLDDQYCKIYKLIIKNALAFYDELKKDDLIEQYLSLYGLQLPEKKPVTFQKRKIAK